MINFGLRKVLGNNANQKGSVVGPTRFRFDFSHDKQMNEIELKQVDEIVIDMISKELPIYSLNVSLETAKGINGLRAVFGEKYPDPVRVISVGVPIEDLLKNPNNDKWKEYSIEFCGGTHLNNSREAQSFTIVG